MLGKETDTKNQPGENPLDTESLEKSWTDSIEALRKSVIDEEPLKKAKGKNYKEEEEEEEEEEDEGMPPGGKVKKSLFDYVGEDPEAEAAMDIEPYLKSLAQGIDKVVKDQTADLSKSLKAQIELTKTMGKAMVSQAEMIKSLQEQIQKMGNVPIPSASRMNKSQGDRFSGNGEFQEELINKEQVMRKALELCKEEKINSNQLTILEGRLNKGLGIPDNLKSLFEVKEGK